MMRLVLASTLFAASTLGCGAVDVAEKEKCTPDFTRCRPGAASLVEKCNDEGTGYLEHDQCGVDELCSGGECIPKQGGTPGGGGCEDSKGCALSEYCVRAIGDCAGSGTCQPVPQSCDGDTGGPVCDCHGVSHDSQCLAAQIKANVEKYGSCN